MNVDMADVNNDGYLDIYVTNIFSAKYKTDEGNMLWLNCADANMPGGRNFHNMAQAAGVMDGGWGWGGKFADFNNDGLLDIFTVNGFVTGSRDRNYWYQIQEMVTQTKNQTADAADWPEMGDRDLSGYEYSRLFIQSPRSGAPAPGRPAAFPSSSSVRGRPASPTCTTAAALPSPISITPACCRSTSPIRGRTCCYYVNKTKLPAGVSFLRIKLLGKPELGMKVAGRTLASTRDAVGGRVILSTNNGQQMRKCKAAWVSHRNPNMPSISAFPTRPPSRRSPSSGPAAGVRKSPAKKPAASSAITSSGRKEKNCRSWWTIVRQREHTRNDDHPAREIADAGREGPTVVVAGL